MVQKSTEKISLNLNDKLDEEGIHKIHLLVVLTT